MAPKGVDRCCIIKYSRFLDTTQFLQPAIRQCALGSYFHFIMRRLRFFNYHRPSHMFCFGMNCCKPFTQRASANLNFFMIFLMFLIHLMLFPMLSSLCIYHFLSMVPSEEMANSFNILHFKMLLS